MKSIFVLIDKHHHVYEWVMGIIVKRFKLTKHCPSYIVHIGRCQTVQLHICSGCQDYSGVHHFIFSYSYPWHYPGRSRQYEPVSGIFCVTLTFSMEWKYPICWALWLLVTPGINQRCGMFKTLSLMNPQYDIIKAKQNTTNRVHESWGIMYWTNRFLISYWVCPTRNNPVFIQLWWTCI